MYMEMPAPYPPRFWVLDLTRAPGWYSAPFLVLVSQRPAWLVDVERYLLLLPPVRNPRENGMVSRRERACGRLRHGPARSVGG